MAEPPKNGARNVIFSTEVDLTVDTRQAWHTKRFFGKKFPLQRFQRMIAKNLE